MKHLTIDQNRWNCLEKGIKVFEEIFMGILVLGIVLLIYGWIEYDQLSFAAVLQSLFIASWVGAFGLVGSIVFPTLFYFFGKKWCRN